MTRIELMVSFPSPKAAILPPEIQSTTGPGNFTAALAAHARELLVAEAPLDFEFMRAWEEIAETRWELSYRRDARNWRNMDDDTRDGETTR